MISDLGKEVKVFNYSTTNAYKGIIPIGEV